MIPRRKLQYANNINEVINAFRLSPLETKEEMDAFYCDGTMAIRTGNDLSSPIQNIITACQNPTDRNAFLLMGHRGCGKSTELNKMAFELRGMGYRVYTVECGTELDLQSPVYADLLILMGDALLKVADECKCNIEKDTQERILSFWNTEIEYFRDLSKEESLNIGVGADVTTPKFFAALFQLMAMVKGDLMYSHAKRETYRQKISNRSSEWLRIMNNVAVSITQKLNGKQPVIIFEDLDKIDPQKAWEAFHNFAATLTGIPIPIIYTFPIALAYEKRSGALDSYFYKETMPIIKIEASDGAEYNEGILTLHEIVERRVNLSLFDEGVLEKIIEKTGGSLRDLFSVINEAAMLAIRGKNEIISDKEATIALSELSISLTRRISGDDYRNLRAMMENKIDINDKDGLLDLMQGNIVLEYQNGERWHSVHPLIRDFLTQHNLGNG